MKRFGFPSESRITHRGTYLAIQTLGRRIVTRHVVFLVRENDCGAPRLGLIVSRKAGKAVLRNRIKRIAREAFRLRRPLAGVPVDIVVIPRRSLPVPPPFAVMDEAFAAFERDYVARYGSRPPQS